MLRQFVTKGLRARQQLQQTVFLAPQALARGFADDLSGDGNQSAGGKDDASHPSFEKFPNALGDQTEKNLGAEGALEEEEEDEEEYEYDYSPPVPVHGVAGRYAAALYMSGAKADLLDEIDVDLSEISNAATESEELRNFLKDPSIPKQAKQGAIDAVLDKLECEDVTKNFFALLNENNRLGEFMKISTTFAELVAAARGEVLATITTAKEVEEGELEEISEALESLLTEDQTLQLQAKVDPSIIGGVIVDIGDKHMDLSIKSRIKRIQQLILETTL